MWILETYTSNQNNIISCYSINYFSYTRPYFSEILLHRELTDIYFAEIAVGAIEIVNLIIILAIVFTAYLQIKEILSKG